MSSPWLSFWCKKIIAQFFYPFPVAVLLLLAAGALLWRKKHERKAKLLLAAAVAILFVCGLPFLPRLLIRPVESRFTPLLEPAAITPHPTAVVVLGMGFNPNPDYPLSMRVSSGMWVRILEGVRLHRALPESRLVLSLSGPAETAAKEEFADELADFLEFDRDRILLITEALTTADEARLAAELLADNPRCLLVTEALHMRRALLTFEQAGIEPIPAPCAYAMPHNPAVGFTIFDVIPAAENLGRCQGGIHELLGTIWQKGKGLFQRPRKDDNAGEARNPNP